MLLSCYVGTSTSIHRLSPRWMQPRKNEVQRIFPHCRDKSIMRSAFSVAKDWRSKRSRNYSAHSAWTCIPSRFLYRIGRSNFRSRFEITMLLMRGSTNYSAGSRRTRVHVRNLQRDRRFQHFRKSHNLLSRLCVFLPLSPSTSLRSAVPVEHGTAMATHVAQGHHQTFLRAAV